jgi:hypothetical protein
MTMKKKERRAKMRMTKKAIAAIWKVLTGLRKTHGSSVNDVCPSCGAKVTLPRPSIREVIVTSLGGCLLVVMLVSACWITEQWIEREGHRILDNMVWHEPLDSWSL